MANRFLAQLQQLTSGQLKPLQREDQQQQPVVIESAFELPPVWRDRIRAELIKMKLHAPSFLTRPELVCGIELHVGGYKVGWSVQEYLLSLSEELGKLITREL